jgi:ABC-type multidrug transport system ATPase subunit
LPAFAMRKIVKRFPGVVANRDVDFTVEPGEIHALLGENGAGKSTLMQILYGFHSMDSGSILMDGKPVAITSPKDAIALGIGMVHQEFMLMRRFSVLENVVLGLKQKFDLRQAASRLRSLSDQHHLAIDPHALVQHLPIGVQQRVEIVKLLYRDARLLILDEPTAVLTTHEKDQLFTVLRALRDQGRSVVIVTHKLKEILELADRVTVMRDGQVVGVVRTPSLTTGSSCLGLTLCLSRSSGNDALYFQPVHRWSRPNLCCNPGSKAICKFADLLKRPAAHEMMRKACGKGVAGAHSVRNLHRNSRMIHGLLVRDQQAATGSAGNADQLQITLLKKLPRASLFPMRFEPKQRRQMDQFVIRQLENVGILQRAFEDAVRVILLTQIHVKDPKGVGARRPQKAVHRSG